MTDTLSYAQAQDHADPLAGWREQFSWPRTQDGDRKIYLCGNSLGLQSQAAAAATRQALSSWAKLAVEGHFSGEAPWLSYHKRAAPALARLIGSHEDEVVAMNTLTINLNLMLLGFYRPTAKQWKVLIEADAFPSDRYAVQSQLQLHGYDPDDGIVQWHSSVDGLEIGQLESLLRAHDDIALILLPGVQYLSGEVLDMQAISTLARDHDIPLGLDLAHAIGNVPMSMHDWQVDFAVFCTYKYLNGGPGAVGGAYVHRRHHGSDTPRLHGWWGNAESTRFRMARQFDPAPGVDVWQQSNPPILGLAPVVGALSLFDDIGIEALRAKSIALTGYLRARLMQDLPDHVHILTPAAAQRQGCQLSLEINHPTRSGREVFNALEAAGVVCDWREPNVIRVAPAPMYNSYTDVWHFVDRLTKALAPT
ncbi:MAG: kynureninase [Pseudomonadota bacterium]